MGGVPSKAEPGRKFQVIGAGQSRTGTVSTQLALEYVLDGPVLHGATHALGCKAGHMKKWVEAYNAKEAGDKERVLRLLRELTEGFVACTDAPPVHFVPELLEIYPDAKVILVTRDPQRWWLCFQWLMAMAATWFIPLLCAMSPRLQHYPSLHKAWRAILDKQVAIAGRAPGDYGPHLLEIHNREVRSVAPKDQLLETSLDKGWGPICEFLGKPIPDVSFPHQNDTTAAADYVHDEGKKLLIRWGVTLTAASGATYMGWRTWGWL